MVYSKELERDVTTTAMAQALLRLKTLAPFLHRAWSVRFFYVRRKNKGCYVHVMCKMRLFWAKTGKTSAYFLRFDIKLKNSHSVLDLVTVLISKQSFFQHHVWPVYQGKSYLHGIALPVFYTVSPFLLQKIKTTESTYLCLAFPWHCHYRERSRMWRRNKFTLTRFRGSSADAHPCINKYFGKKWRPR